MPEDSVLVYYRLRVPTIGTEHLVHTYTVDVMIHTAIMYVQNKCKTCTFSIDLPINVHIQHC